MKVSDQVYGEVDIREKVLEEMLDSEALTRLRASPVPGTNPLVNAYRHALGTMILTRRFVGSIQWQVAALLHESAPRDYGGVIELVLDKFVRVAYDAKKFGEYVREKRVPSLLERYGLNPAFLFEEAPLIGGAGFSLHTIDQTLRAAVEHGYRNVVQKCLDSLTMRDHLIVFDAREGAEQFFECGKLVQDDKADRVQRMAGTYVLARAVNAALDAKIISMKDLMNGTQGIRGTLYGAGTDDIRSALDLLDGGFEVSVSPENPEYLINLKREVPDPLFVDVDDKVKRLSDVSTQYKAWSAQVQKENEVPIVIVPER